MNVHDTSHPVLYDRPRFSLGHMTRCGADLRKIGSDASSMEEVASRTVRYLYERLRDRTLDAQAFARTHVPREVANLFKTLALNVRLALLPFASRRVFA